MEHLTKIRRGATGEPLTGSTRPLWSGYLELTKPGITVSNLLATLSGAWLAAGGWGDLSILAWVLAGTALVVAGGCVGNNVRDRDIDPLMERTRNRAIPAGRIPWRQARLLGWLLSILGVAILGWTVNGLTAFWAALGVCWYVFVYTAWLKRCSPWNTVLGGVAGAIPPVIGWIAVTGTLGIPGWTLFLLLFCWQPPHFYALALLKEKEYRRAGIPMWPVVRGREGTWKQMVVFTCALLPLSLFFPFLGLVSWMYLLIVLPAGVLFCWWTWRGKVVRNEERWARQVFRLSLYYLMGWMLAVFLFAG